MSLTKTEIKTIADKHADAWRNKDPRTSDSNLRTQIEAAIGEALAKQAKLYEDGARTMRHERAVARAEADGLRLLYEPNA